MQLMWSHNDTHVDFYIRHDFYESFKMSHTYGYEDKYEICERSTHDGYISLGINNKYNMIGAEIIGEFCCSSVGDRTILNDFGDKNRRIREQQLLRFFDK